MPEIVIANNQSRMEVHTDTDERKGGMRKGKDKLKSGQALSFSHASRVNMERMYNH